MDGQGTGSCTMLGSSPSRLSFLISPLVRLSDVGLGEAGKGGSRVITPDMVVMEKVSALDLGVSLSLIVKRIWENCSCNSLWCWSSIFPIPFAWDFFSSIKYRRFDKTSEGKDHRRCLPRQAYLLSQVALLSKWKKRLWVVTYRLIDRLGIGHILQFDSPSYSMRELKQN
nr:hypothetical protein [Tanacetum cinerariifolium]